MTPLKRYFLLFAAMLVGASIALAIISTFIDTTLTGVSIILPLLAAQCAGQDFVTREARRLTDAERKRLVRGSFGIYAVFQLLVTPLALLDPSVRATLADIVPLLAVMVVVLLLLTYGMIVLGYGWATTRLANKRGLD